MFSLAIGMVLKPRPHTPRDWDDETVEIVGYCRHTDKYCIVVAENFSAWKTVEEICRDYEPLSDDKS